MVDQSSPCISVSAAESPREIAFTMDKIIKQGKLLFGIAIAAIGAENLICAHVSQLVFANNPPAVPVLPFVPTIPFLVYFVGIALLAAGVCMAANIRPRFAAILLGVFFLLWTLVLLVPKAVARPLDLNIRTCVFEVLALGASALTLAGCLEEDVRSSMVGSLFVGRLIDKLVASAPSLFAISSVIFGVTHFLIPRVIASLIPAWIPGGLFWAYFYGTAFIAAGVSIATGFLARWGAFWLGVMFLLWFVLLHAPLVATHLRDPAQWSSAFIALGMCGGSWICAWYSQQRRRQNTN
jgi:uncharacterized membrane protein YphA (DoxX/SURF4 family)